MRRRLNQLLRRFCLHILPEGFVKIRHYGLLSNRGRQQRIAQARSLLSASAALKVAAAKSASSPEQQPAAAPKCPHCGGLNLRLVDIYHQPHQIPRSLLPKQEAYDSS